MIILSDLSEVHIRGIQGTDRFLARKFAENSIGRHGIKERCWHRHRKVTGAFRDLLRGRITEDEYWSEFFAVGQWPFTAEDAKAALSANLREVMPHGATKVLERIVKYPRSLDPVHGHELGLAEGMPTIYLVSDHIENRIEEVKAAHPGLFRLFAREFWSCDIGLIKQDPGFFATILEEGNLKPEETLFIDDDIRNVAAASRAGIPGIKFENNIQLETVLHETYGFQFAPADPD